MFWAQVTDINLDHDISYQVVIGELSRPYPSSETFETVARYIALLKRAFESEGWTPAIRLHTSNPVGAANMQKILFDAGLGCTIQLAKGANRLENML